MRTRERQQRTDDLPPASHAHRGTVRAAPLASHHRQHPEFSSWKHGRRPASTCTTCAGRFAIRGARVARGMLPVFTMPYATNNDLPARVRRVLPQHAQDIYRAAFNNAFEHYGADHEATAHRVAWAAVKRRYMQRAAGFWVSREDVA